MPLLNRNSFNGLSPALTRARQPCTRRNAFPPHPKLRRYDYGHVRESLLTNNIIWLQPCVICVPALDLLYFR